MMGSEGAPWQLSPILLLHTPFSVPQPFALRVSTLLRPAPRSPSLWQCAPPAARPPPPPPCPRGTATCPGRRTPQRGAPWREAASRPVMRGLVGVRGISDEVPVCQVPYAGRVRVQLTR